MISDDSLSFKHITLKILLFCSVLIAAYLLFVSLVSIWVGISHVRQAGYWMPVLAGTMAMLVVLSLFWLVLRFIRAHLKEKDSLQY